MDTWRELAVTNLTAAKSLLRESLYRSAVSRCYYAAFAAVTDRAVQRGVQFPHGGNNPTHDQVVTIAAHNLELVAFRRREMVALIRRLRSARISADYIPVDKVDEAAARASLRDAARVFSLLEIVPDE